MSTLKKSQNRPLNMVSLFAGIGGFELGFHKAGIETTMVCEIDEIAQQVLKTNMPGVRIESDICSLDKLPIDTDILCAGFPCQDLSTIGVKTCLDGERSSLVREVFRLLQNQRVEWVIFENVPNMLHLKKGEAIKTIVEELEQLGYKWAYRTIDSLAFVPQKRRRVFVIASLNHDPRNVILSGNSMQVHGEIAEGEGFTAPCGFYWTEGKYAIGLYKNGIPTLKVGSSLGIPSAPAIAFPNGEVGTPDIRDAERLQGFPIDWTKPAEEITKPSARWKLVGNAVTVDVIEWIANKILKPEIYDASADKRLSEKAKWPNAAWGSNGERYKADITMSPIDREEQSLSDFLKFPCKPLSLKAATGFEKRLNIGTVRCPQFFRDAIHNYVEMRSEENG